MRILLLVFLLIFEISAIDLLSIDNRYNFTAFNDSVSGTKVDVFATNGGIIVSENGSINEISITTEGSPIGKVITLDNDADTVLWAGTESRGLYKLVHATGEVTRTTDFDNISINAIDRDSNAASFLHAQNQQKEKRELPPKLGLEMRREKRFLVSYF